MNIHKVPDGKLRMKIDEAIEGLTDSGMVADDCLVGVAWAKDDIGRKVQVQIRVTAMEEDWVDDEFLVF